MPLATRLGFIGQNAMVIWSNCCGALQGCVIGLLQRNVAPQAAAGQEIATYPTADPCFSRLACISGCHISDLRAAGAHSSGCCWGTSS
jgi:hypothetical protein